MKPSATGRILLWRGGSLWVGLAGEPAGFHAHHAVQIALPFPPGQVRFQVPAGSWTSYDAAIVAAEQPHAFEARNQFMATIFVEPESLAGRQLQQRCGVAGVSALDAAQLRAEAAALATAYEQQDSDERLISLTRSVITKVAGTSPTPAKPSDERVAQAIELIRERLSETISLNSIASAVHLSPDRFRHLFMEETGVGLRPYVLWLRLESPWTPTCRAAP